MNKLDNFLNSAYAPNSFDAILKAFLQNKIDLALSEKHIRHLFDSLYPLSEHLGNPALSNVTRGELETYGLLLRRNYALGSVRSKVGDIKLFFRWCKKQKIIRKDVAKRLPKPSRRRVLRSRKPKSVADQNVLLLMQYLAERLKKRGLLQRNFFGILEAAPREDWKYPHLQQLRNLFIVCFLYETGARAGEIAELGCYTMNQACNAHSKTYTVNSFGKEEDRDLRFTNATAELWRAWNQVRPPGSDEFAVVVWLPGQSPRQASTEAISNALVRCCKAAGIRPFRSHAYRHAKINRGRQTVGIEITSRLIDHYDVEMTSDYGEIANEQLNDAALRTGLNRDLFGRG